MDGYSIKEAAELLGVPRRRVRELIASGVLLGTTDRGGAARVHLRPPGEAASAISTDPGHKSTTAGASDEASPFRELLNEFRNLTERYGQALLALGEARGETAALRSRLDQLEAHVDLRLPGPSATSVDWHAPVGATPAQPVEEEPMEVAASEAEPEEAPRRRGRRHAFSEFAEALARAEDPNAADLPEPVEASSAASLPDLELPEPEPEPASLEPAAAEPAQTGMEERAGDEVPEAATPSIEAAEEPVEAATPSLEAEELPLEAADGQRPSETDAELAQPAAPPLEEEEPPADHQPEPELIAEADTEREIEAQAADAEDQEIVAVESPAFEPPTEEAAAAIVPPIEDAAEVQASPDLEEAAPPIPSEPTILPGGPYSADLEEPDWIDEGEYTWLDAGEIAETPAPEAQGVGTSGEADSGDEMAASVPSTAGAEEEVAPAADAEDEVPAAAGGDGEVELMWLGGEREDADRYAAELEVASFGQPPSPLDVTVESPAAEEAADDGAGGTADVAVRDDMNDRAADFAAPDAADQSRDVRAAFPPSSSDTPSDGAPPNELSRIAQDQGWDDSEVEAIRSLLGGTPIADTPIADTAMGDTPAFAPAPHEEPRDAPAESPAEGPEPQPTWPRQDRVTRLTLPGARDLDDALAALRRGASDQAANDAPPRVEEGRDVAARDASVRSEAAATEPGEPRVEDMPAGEEQGSEGEPEWLRGRRDPAARAYRRLRRIFPS